MQSVADPAQNYDAAEEGMGPHAVSDCRVRYGDWVEIVEAEFGS